MSPKFTTEKTEAFFVCNVKNITVCSFSYKRYSTVNASTYWRLLNPWNKRISHLLLLFKFEDMNCLLFCPSYEGMYIVYV